MARKQETLTFSGALEVQTQKPLDARTRVETKADLTDPASYPYAYEGMSVYVIEEQKEYILVGVDTTQLANWREKGTGGGGETPTLDAVLKKGNTSTENVTVGNLYTVNVSGNRTDVEPAGITTTYLYEGKDNQKNAGLMYDAVFLEHLEKQPNGTYLPVTDFAVNSNGNVDMNDAVKQSFKNVLEVPEAYDDTALIARVSANETAIADRYTKAQTDEKIADAMTDVDNEHFHPVTVLPDPADADPTKRPKENHEYVLVEYEQDGTTIKSETHYLFYDGAYHQKKTTVSLDGYATEQYVDDGLDQKASLNIATIPGGGGGDEISATVSQGADSVNVNYYKDSELPNSLNLNVGEDAFRIPTTGYVDNALANKQDTLVSGTNIKKIGNIDLLGSGAINVATVNNKSLLDGGNVSTAKITYDAEYQTTQIKDAESNAEIGINKVDSNTLNINEYAPDSRGQSQEVFNMNIPTKGYVDDALADKQDTLVSGTNIKTVNGNDLMGDGDVVIRSGVGDEYDLTAMPSYNEIVADIADHKLRYIGGNWQVRSISKEASDITLTAVYSNQKREYRFEENDPDAPLPEPWTFSDGYTDDTTMSVSMSPDKTISHLQGNGGYARYTLHDDRIEFTQRQATGQTPFTKSYTIGTNIKVGEEKWQGTYTDENGVTYQVYSKMVYIPALPATAGITTYEHGVSNIKQILNIYGFTADGFVLNAPRQNAQDNIAIYQASKSATNQTFSIEVGKDRSSKKAYVVMVYAKNN